MILSMIAKLLARSAIADAVIRHSMKTPDEHLPGYMHRYWLFNQYDRSTRRPKFSWFPISIRVHHILREDHARHDHDHPWNARTFILRGWYLEQRKGTDVMRVQGQTAAIGFGEYHNIAIVAPGGVWTLFVMGRYRGTWGFMVDGQKVPHDEYGVDA